jgi:hypothetical protein
MQFKAYQHYFHQRSRDSIGAIATQGNQARRAYRPVTANQAASRSSNQVNNVTLNFQGFESGL